jgi:hypothetical protein
MRRARAAEVVAPNAVTTARNSFYTAPVTPCIAKLAGRTFETTGWCTISGNMPVQHTRGFRSVLHRSDHFSAHGQRLGVLTEEEYEILADNFLGPLISSTTRQHKRSWNGDLVRYDEVADVFAVLDRDGFIKTCYRPDPQVHGAPTNLDYYLDEEENA